MAPVKKTQSALSMMAEDPNLRRSMEKAKSAPPGGRDYEGEDADLVCRLVANRGVKVKGVPAAVLEFRILPDYPGQADIAGQKASLWFVFEDGNRGTAEEVQAYYYEALAGCEFDTKADNDTLEAEIDQAIRDSKPILVQAKWNGNYLNFRVLGPADPEPVDDPDTSMPSYWDGRTIGCVIKGQEVPFVVCNPDDENGWFDLNNENGELAWTQVPLDDPTLVFPNALPAAEGGEQDRSGQTPSDFNGYCATYDGQDGFWVSDANDEDRTVNLVDTNEEIAYEALDFDDPYLAIVGDDLPF